MELFVVYQVHLSVAVRVAKQAASCIAEDLGFGGANSVPYHGAAVGVQRTDGRAARSVATAAGLMRRATIPLSRTTLAITCRRGAKAACVMHADLVPPRGEATVRIDPTNGFAARLIGTPRRPVWCTALPITRAKAGGGAGNRIAARAIAHVGTFEAGAVKPGCVSETGFPEYGQADATSARRDRARNPWFSTRCTVALVKAGS